MDDVPKLQMILMMNRVLSCVDSSCNSDGEGRDGAVTVCTGAVTVTVTAVTVTVTAVTVIM